MFKFHSGNLNDIQDCSCSIEPKTRLLLIEQKREHEDHPRYIRLTGQQVNRIKELFFKGSFYSTTKPSNFFSLEGNIITMYCMEENQVIKLSVKDMGNVYRYFEIHNDRIARFDSNFRK